MLELQKNAKKRQKTKKTNSTEFCSARRRFVWHFWHFGKHFGRHLRRIYIHIYNCMERDVELMRCQPLVCAGGGLMPYCCTQTRGGRRGAKQWYRCARPYFHAPAFRRRSSKLGRRAHRTGAVAKAAKVAYCTHPYSHAPPFGGDVRAQGGVCRTKQRGTSCARPNSHAPTFRRGSSELQGDVHNGPGQTHDEAKRVMRGGDGS